MRTLRVMLAVALVIVPACAQAKGGGKRHQSDETSAQKKPDDTAYKKALSAIPDQKPADPWAGKR
jgi:hypothetical protein